MITTMKRFALLAIAITFILSCNSDVMTVGDLMAIGNDLELIEKDIADKYHVTTDDVDDYVNFRKLEAKGKGKILEVTDIKTIYTKSGNPSMYIICYSEGWDIISADKRTPVIVATSEIGKFNFSREHPILEYIEGEAENIELISRNCNQQMILTKNDFEESNENTDFWEHITADSDIINSYEPNIKDLPPLIPEGHWELTGVTSRPIVYDSICHLTTTQWHQGYPYNKYCPTDPNNQNKRSAAGCVAVAGAQMLYYLHQKLNINPSIPTIVPNPGYVGNEYPNDFTNFRSDHWDNMTNDQIATLISYIGNLVNMSYSYNSSGAVTKDLIEDVFTSLGISSTWHAFDTNIIKTSLSSEMPVIVSAQTASDGHSLIIDGYKRFRTEYTYMYEWVYDSPTEEMIEIKKPIYELEYSSPYITQVQMNWGWGETYPSNDLDNNNIWYNPTDSWIVNIIKNNSYTTDEFSSKRGIIYNFSKIE